MCWILHGQVHRVHCQGEEGVTVVRVYMCVCRCVCMCMYLCFRAWCVSVSVRACVLCICVSCCVRAFMQFVDVRDLACTRDRVGRKFASQLSRSKSVLLRCQLFQQLLQVNVCHSNAPIRCVHTLNSTGFVIMPTRYARPAALSRCAVDVCDFPFPSLAAPHKYSTCMSQ